MIPDRSLLAVELGPKRWMVPMDAVRAPIGAGVLFLHAVAPLRGVLVAQEAA